jgi:hypothetical protein
MQDECTENESGKESGKVSRQNGWKRKMQDTDGILERKKKEHGEEGKRGSSTRGMGTPVKKRKD